MQRTAPRAELGLRAALLRHVWVLGAFLHVKVKDHITQESRPDGPTRQNKPWQGASPGAGGRTFRRRHGTGLLSEGMAGPQPHSAGGDSDLPGPFWGRVRTVPCVLGAGPRWRVKEQERHHRADPARVWGSPETVVALGVIQNDSHADSRVCLVPSTCKVPSPLPRAPAVQTLDDRPPRTPMSALEPPRHPGLCLHGREWTRTGRQHPPTCARLHTDTRAHAWTPAQ